MKKFFLPALALGLSLTAAQAQNARVQVIHNCPNADTVDVYLGNTRILDNFVYRTATGYVDVPAGSDTLFVAPANSTSKADAIYNLPVTTVAGNEYVIIAAGLVGGTPGFQLFVNGGKETGVADSTDLLVFHGSHNAPTVSVRGADVSTVIIDSFAFGEFRPNNAGYLRLSSAADLIVRITTADGATVVASYTAPLTTLGGQTAVVFASGYLNATGNQPAFGLFAAVGNNVVALPLLTTTSVSQQAVEALQLRAFPNPANDRLQLEFSLERDQEVAFRVFDMQGRLVKDLAAVQMNSGVNTQSIELAGLSTGLYNVQVITSEGIQTVKLQVAK